MKPLREVTVFCGGDINKINTWSGVPYFFCNALKEKGIKINYISIAIERKLEWIYNKITGPIIIKLLRNIRADYSTSLLRYLIIKKKIKNGVLRYPCSDCLLFFSFCYSGAGVTKIPSVMISDWTLDYFMKFNLKREPLLFERRALRRDDRQIEMTEAVFSLFPKISEYLRQKYINKNIYYLGNGVNSLVVPSIDNLEMISVKKKSCKLLFIGEKKYLKGLQTLISAFRILKSDFPKLSIHVIGMNEKDINSINDDNIFFYGYLSKDIKAENEIYYNLLREATVYVNTTPLWSSFQAPIEVMYFYTPIIISPNIEFNKTFGDDIEKCCTFCTENDPTLLSKHIKEILTSDKYANLSETSHSTVKNFTWDAVTDNFLNTISEVI